MGFPRSVKGVAGKNDRWVSFFRSIGSRRLFSSDPSALGDERGNAISFSLDGLGHRLRRVFEELDGTVQHPNKGKSMADRADLPEKEAGQKGPGKTKNGTLQLEVAHSMPEWIAFVDVLVEGDYLLGRSGNETLLFERRVASKKREKGKDEEEAILSRGFASFASHRMDLMRHLSRRDIQLLVATGCPELNPKIITSSKRLRAYVHIDEGEVCSACHLRGSCSMAYVTPCKKETARMIDLLRLLYVFGYASQTHPSDGHSQRNTRGPLRRLFQQLVELSKLPFNQDYKNSTAKVDNFGWEDLEMKKGDWMCPKCEFMNFAKNRRCLRCGVPPPRKQLKPGEWECPGCGYINYRRNKSCYKCECNRPSTSNDLLNFDSFDASDVANSKAYKEWKWKKPNENETTRI